MNKIRISDVTMKQTGPEISLSFREKIELAKLLDKLGVSVIELEPIEQTKIDSLRIKSVAAAVKNSIVAVPVALNEESIQQTWNALKEAKKARLQVNKESKKWLQRRIKTKSDRKDIYVYAHTLRERQRLPVLTYTVLPTTFMLKLSTTLQAKLLLLQTHLASKKK